MSTREPVEAPQLPAKLLDPRPMLAVITLAWVVALVAAFVVPGLQTWRPVTVSGVGVGALAAGIYLWQRTAARRGRRGAQSGLN